MMETKEEKKERKRSIKTTHVAAHLCFSPSPFISWLIRFDRSEPLLEFLSIPFAGIPLKSGPTRVAAAGGEEGCCALPQGSAKSAPCIKCLHFCQGQRREKAVMKDCGKKKVCMYEGDQTEPAGSRDRWNSRKSRQWGSLNSELKAFLLAFYFPLYLKF